jgi:hypothetical protein
MEGFTLLGMSRGLVWNLEACGFHSRSGSYQAISPINVIQFDIYWIPSSSPYLRKNKNRR